MSVEIEEEEVLWPCWEEEEGIDWAALSEEVEEILHSSSSCTSSLSFSLNAIFAALVSSYYQPRAAAELLLMNEAASSSAKRPCRFLLTGRCMRSDCLFEHGLYSYYTSSSSLHYIDGHALCNIL